MALSGSTSIAVTSHDTLRFSWTATQSVADNTSTISWAMQLITDYYGSINSTADKTWAVNINGTGYSGINYIGIGNNSTKTLASGTTPVVHNADGTKTFSYTFTQEFDITFSGTKIWNIYGNGSGELDPIPRAATITAAPNFTDEDNPTIEYSNPAGTAVESLRACISFTGENPDIEYRDVEITGSSYTFELTDDERDILRNGTTDANSRTVYFYLRTVIGGNILFTKLAKTLTIVNCSPTLTATVVDSDTVANGLTGNVNSFIRYYSDASYSIGATAYKGASIVSRTFTVGGTVYTASSGVIENVEDASFIFSVTDSRGNTVSEVVDKTLIPYVKLSCNLQSTTPTGEGEVTLTISGNYFNGSFGSTSNSLVISYRYKTGSGSYGNWTTATASKSGNTYSAVVNLTGLDYRNAYTFQARATDSLATINSVEITGRAVPVFDWGANDFNFNVPVTFGDTVTGNDASFTDISATEVSATTLRASGNIYDKSGQRVTNGLTIYSSSGIDPDTTLEHLILTNVNTPNGGFMYVKTEFYSSKSTTSNRMQTAYPYADDYPPHYRYYAGGAWSAWMSDGEFILYDCEWPGEAGNITLSDSYDNYRYLEVYIGDNVGAYGGYHKILCLSNLYVAFSMDEANGATTHFTRTSQYQISGTSMTPVLANCGYAQMASKGSTYVSRGTNYLRIYRVVGRK